MSRTPRYPVPPVTKTCCFPAFILYAVRPNRRQWILWKPGSLLSTDWHELFSFLTKDSTFGHTPVTAKAQPHQVFKVAVPGVGARRHMQSSKFEPTHAVLSEVMMMATTACTDKQW